MYIKVKYTKRTKVILNILHINVAIYIYNSQQNILPQRVLAETFFKAQFPKSKLQAVVGDPGFTKLSKVTSAGLSLSKEGVGPITHLFQHDTVCSFSKSRQTCFLGSILGTCFSSLSKEYPASMVMFVQTVTLWFMATSFTRPMHI